MLAGTKRFEHEQPFQLLRERRLRHLAPADAEQLDLAVQRRVLSLGQRAHDVMRGGKIVIAIELPSGERDEMRRVEPRVLRVDRDEHLDDVIFGKPVEDHRRHRERLAAEVLHAGVERKQPVLAVDRAQNPLAFGHFQDPERRRSPRCGSNFSFSSQEMMTAPGIDGRSRA